MQCRRIPRQILLERYYREQDRLNCQRQESPTNLFSESYNWKRHLGVNCFKEKVQYLGNGYLIPDYSTRLRKLNAIKQGKGTTQFTALTLNDYGKIEGAPGGFGSSPKNRF
jgi:hypothetical protein